MRCNSSIIRNRARGEAGKWRYDNIIANDAVMQDYIGSNSAVIANNGSSGYLDIGMDHSVTPYPDFILYENCFRISEADTVCHQPAVLLMLQILIGRSKFALGIDAEEFLSPWAGVSIHLVPSANCYSDNIGKINLALLVVASDSFQGIEEKGHFRTVNARIDLSDFFLHFCCIFLFGNFLEPALIVSNNATVIG